MDLIRTARLSDYEAEENKWIWQPYIAQGTVSIIAGLGGKGKSFLSMAIAAAITNGQALPGDVAHLPPSNVFLKNAENHTRRMVRPRAEIVGADVSRIVMLPEGEEWLTLKDERLERLIVQENIAVAIIDPLQAHLPQRVSMNNAESIRPVFTHLAGVAERTNCSIILVGHVNKGSGTSSDRLLGSADVFNSVLSVMMVGKIDAEDGISAMIHVKSNMDELGRSQAFRLSKESGFEWLGECDATASDVLREGESGGGYDNDTESISGKKTRGAVEFLKNLLANGPVEATKIPELAEDNGIKDITLFRAKEKAGVESKNIAGTWVWKLKE